MAATLKVDIQLTRKDGQFKAAWIVNAEPVVKTGKGTLASVLSSVETMVRTETGLGLLDSLEMHVIDRFGGPL